MASKIKKHLVANRIHINSNQMDPRPEWQEICQTLSKDYKLPRLRELAEEFQVDTEGKTKRQLCMEIAKIVDTTCTNHENLGLITISSLDPDVYTLTENGHQYCFDRSDYDGYIRAKKKNPYTRATIPNLDLTRMTEKWGEQLIVSYQGPRILNYNDSTEEYEQNQHEYHVQTGNLSFVYQNDLTIIDNYSPALPSVMVNGHFNSSQLIQNCFINSIKVNVPLNVIIDLVTDFEKEYPNMNYREEMYTITDYVPVIRLSRGWDDADGYKQITDCIKFVLDYNNSFDHLMNLFGYIDAEGNISKYFSQSEIILLNYIRGRVYYNGQYDEVLAQQIYEEQWPGHPEMIAYANSVSEDFIANIYNIFQQNPSILLFRI